MKLRTQILLLLLAFALMPLLIIMASNFPRVLDLLGSLNRELYLQDLRSDFRDLDLHLVSRQELLRLLAKLPEPGVMLGQVDKEDTQAIDLTRTHYTEWINRILPDQLDIIEIQFLDAQGQLRFWLERDRDSAEWKPTLEAPVSPEPGLVEQTLAAKRADILISKVRIRPEEKSRDPRRVMNLHLISPLGFIPDIGAAGAVAMTVDIGGMARRFNETFWAYDDGRYLEVSPHAESGSTAYADFPGLEASFRQNRLFLWEADKRQVIWIPLIQTESSGPVWVGREVDASPLEDFRAQLVMRVGAIVLLLMLITWLVARWLALQADRLGYDLTDGITRLLEKDEKTEFDWKWTAELKSLSEKLTRLAEKHVRNNRELVRHTRELEESNRYKSQFLANVSHELRTPLNSILLLSKMLADRETGLPAEQAEQASVIHRAGKDLQQLIEDILDLSKIEARKTSLNLENIRIRDLVNDVMELVRPQFDQQHLSLTFKSDPAVPEMMNSDPDKIRQILKNFLSNAVKFTEKGGVTVTLCQGRSEKLPVCISVRDSGIGIARSQHKLIFQAFKQADGSTSRRYGGTGLGLSISLELAHLLGGDIDVISEPGEGAEFRLNLPRVFDRETLIDEQVGVDEPLIDEAQLPGPAASASFTGHHVLVAVAEMQDMLTLSTLLESWSLSVTGACDLDEMLEALEDESFSLVLMDVSMNSENENALARIRALYSCEKLPLIALASQPQMNAQHQYLLDGANACLLKPVAPAELEEQLESFLTEQAKDE